MIVEVDDLPKNRTKVRLYVIESKDDVGRGIVDPIINLLMDDEFQSVNYTAAREEGAQSSPSPRIHR
jgi:hypothetical protein